MAGVNPGEKVRRSMGMGGRYVSPVRVCRDAIVLYLLAGRKPPNWMRQIARGDPHVRVPGWTEQAGAMRR